jgi:hypothetical protein
MSEWTRDDINTGIETEQVLLIDEEFKLLIEDSAEDYFLLIQEDRPNPWTRTSQNND